MDIVDEVEEGCREQAFPALEADIVGVVEAGCMEQVSVVQAADIVDEAEEDCKEQSCLVLEVKDTVATVEAVNNDRLDLQVGIEIGIGAPT